MTPQQIMEAARRRYNAIGDTFWSDDEIYQSIYDGELQASIDAPGIMERIYTTTTTAGTQEYAFPTNVLAVKRVTYNGQKLKKITMREDDSITGLNQDTTDQGTPTYYYEFDESIFLRPIPDDALTLKIWAYQEPDTVNATATLELPSVFHMSLVDYVLYQMAFKDSNHNAADRLEKKWEKAIMRMKAWVAKRKRTDSFAAVQDEESSIGSWLGHV